MEVAVRFEQPGDAAGIREVNEQAFGAPDEARIVDALRGSDGSISLVAAIAGTVVGHILFTPVTIEPPSDVRAAGLAPMAVRPGHQRQGVGTQLIRAGLAACRDRGYSAVVVLGHPEYYPRFGFRPAHAFGLRCEFAVAPDAFMAIALHAGALDGAGGLVRYRPDFAGTAEE